MDFTRLIPFGDYGDMDALDFERMIAKILKNDFGKIVSRQILVKNRGDGRRGRVDLVVEDENEKIAIEIDRKSPRKKSIFKLQSLKVDRRIVMLRSPYTIIEVEPSVI